MTCEEILRGYVETLHARFHCRKMENGRLAIVTPFTYPDHDLIEIYVRPAGDEVVVSDLGETLRHLDSQGMDVLRSETLRFATERIAAGYSAKLVRGAIAKTGPAVDLSRIMHDVIAACGSVASLIYNNRSYEPAPFDDTAAAYFESAGFNVTNGGRVIGRSNQRYEFSMVLSWSGPAGWRQCAVKTISPKSRSNVKKEVEAAFTMWADIDPEKPERPNVTLINDEIVPAGSPAYSLLGRLSRVYAWSQRKRLSDDLHKLATA